MVLPHTLIYIAIYIVSSKSAYELLESLRNFTFNNNYSVLELCPCSVSEKNYETFVKLLISPNRLNSRKSIGQLSAGKRSNPSSWLEMESMNNPIHFLGRNPRAEEWHVGNPTMRLVSLTPVTYDPRM